MFETSSRPYANFYQRHVGCVNMAAAESSVIQWGLHLWLPTREQELRKGDLNSSMHKTAPQPHKNQQFSSDLSSWKPQWLILSGIFYLPRNREVIPRQYDDLSRHFQDVKLVLYSFGKFFFFRCLLLVYYNYKKRNINICTLKLELHRF